MNRPQDPWLMLAVLFTARTAAGFVFQSIGSSGPAIAAALAIDFALIGTLIGLFKLPGIPLSIPSGALASYFGERTLITLGLGLMALGCLLTAAASDFLVAATGRLLSGVGFVIANLYFAKATLDWFTGSTRLPLAMGILVSSWPLGLSLGLMTQGAITAALGWQATMLACGALAGASTLLMLLLYREAPGRTVPPASGLSALRALSPQEWRDITLISAVWGLLNVGLVMVAGFTPALLVSLGYELTDAGSLVSISMWAALVSIPLGGFLAGWIGNSRLVIVLSTLGSVVLYAALAWWPASVWVYLLYGLVAGAAAGPVMAQPTELLRPSNRAAGMGVFYTTYYLLMSGMPALAGWLRDAAGPRAPLILAAGMMLLSLAAQAALWARPRPDPEPASKPA
ncbi:MAG: MFS transporter [Hyphomicrobiaceae bacterium]|nr:MFS transporter [Hyphomicrobiaceae bacterium]